MTGNDTNAVIIYTGNMEKTIVKMKKNITREKYETEMCIASGMIGFVLPQLFLIFFLLYCVMWYFHMLHQ